MLGDVRERAAEALIAGDLDAELAMQQLIDAYAAEAAAPIRAVRLEANRIEDIQWPDAVLDPDGITLDIVAAHRRVKGEPWSRFVVLLLERVPPQLVRQP